MGFRLLGPLEVDGPAGPIDVRGPKRRGLLAYLLVHHGDVVSVDRLVDDLWDGHPSAGAPATVRTYVSQLRKALAAVEHCSLETHPGGYRLTLDADHLDSARFERRAGDASQQSGPAARLAALDDALRLWRGTPLEEWAGSGWADREAVRLGTLHLRARQARIDALLALGRHGEAVAEIERLLPDHRLDERLWAQLMLAYYREGRQADALRAYQDLRSILVDELGIEPGPELRELEGRILDHDASLAAPDPPRELHEVGPAPRPVAPPHRPQPSRRRRVALVAVVAVACAVGLVAATASGTGEWTGDRAEDPSARQLLADAQAAVAASDSVELVVEYDAEFTDLPGYTEHGERHQAVVFPDRGRTIVAGEGRTTERLYVGDDYYVHEGVSPAELAADPFQHAHLDEPTLGLAHTDWFPLSERPQDLAQLLDQAHDPVLASRDGDDAIRVDFRRQDGGVEAEPLFAAARGTVVLDETRHPRTITITGDGPVGRLTASIRFTRWNGPVVIEPPDPTSLDPTPPTIELTHLRIVGDDGQPIAGGGGVMACPLDRPDPAVCGDPFLYSGADLDTGVVRPLSIDPFHGYEVSALVGRDDWPCPRYRNFHYSEAIWVFGWELVKPTVFVIHQPEPQDCGL